MLNSDTFVDLNDPPYLLLGTFLQSSSDIEPFEFI